MALENKIITMISSIFDIFEKISITKIGEVIWNGFPEGGIIIFALFILTIIWIIFYRKR